MECQIEVWASLGRREFCEEACLHGPVVLAVKFEKTTRSGRLVNMLYTLLLARIGRMLLCL
jgi:hypothetical protein